MQIVGHGTKFTRKKEEAIAALLTQRSVEDAARAAGVGTQTLLRWLMTDPNVSAAVKLRAAECVFDRAMKGVELEDMAARVSALERVAEASRK